MLEVWSHLASERRSTSRPRQLLPQGSPYSNLHSIRSRDSDAHYLPYSVGLHSPDTLGNSLLTCCCQEEFKDHILPEDSFEHSRFKHQEGQCMFHDSGLEPPLSHSKRRYHSHNMMPLQVLVLALTTLSSVSATLWHESGHSQSDPELWSWVDTDGGEAEPVHLSDHAVSIVSWFSYDLCSDASPYQRGCISIANFPLDSRVAIERITAMKCKTTRTMSIAQACVRVAWVLATSRLLEILDTRPCFLVCLLAQSRVSCVGL